MKGKRIEKWKKEGIKEFIYETLRNQIARRQIEGIDDFKLNATMEMIPFIYGVSIREVNKGNSFTFMGRELNIH